MVWRWFDIELNRSKWKGIAILPDGTSMPYREYVGDGCLPHPYWKKVRFKRYEFDDCKCAVCRKPLDEKSFRTHHLDYSRCGHEGLRDVITLCDDDHAWFHQNWKPAEYFREEDENHWDVFNLEETAKLCGRFLQEDYWFGGELNCCSIDVCGELIDDYFKGSELFIPPTINPNDIQLYFRNRRYDLLLEAERERDGFVLDKSVNKAVDDFLDEHFGKKGGKGGNKNRSDARSFIVKHDSESFHRNRWFLRYINILIEEAKKYE